MFIDASVYARCQMIGPTDDCQSDPNLINTETESEKPRQEARPNELRDGKFDDEPKSLVLG